MEFINYPQFQHPFSAFCSGPSGVGKTFFLKGFLENRRQMINPPPDKVIWFHGITQQIHEEISDVTFVQGFPINYKDYLGNNSLIILDDLMAECADDKRLTFLFSKGCHHLNVSLIFVTQNIFHKGKEMRTCSLNANYLIVFKNRRDPSQIMHLGRQLYPRRTKFFQEAYDDATNQPFAYLLIDLRNQTCENMRLRANILPNQQQFFYRE